MRRLTILMLICLAADYSRGAEGSAASGRQAMVATVQPLATEAGVAALRAGGNAVDAAVAAALTLGVVDGHNSGIGGGCFMVLRLANGRIVALDGRETAPRGAHRDMYLRDGKAEPQLSQTGPLAVATPGALAAYASAVENFGNRSLADLLEAAAEIAERGFPLDAVYAARLQAERKTLARFEGSRAVLLQPDGRPYQFGQTLRQPDLAATYRAIAQHGTGWFYGGPFAERVERWMRGHGGLLTAEDFRQYQVKLRTPLRSSYRGYEIVGFPPPSSGGVHVAQILNILENFPLADASPPDRVHLVAEAMKRAFADRAYWLGDPDFAQVPRGLIDQSYAARLAKQIDTARAVRVPGHGQPPAWQTDVFGKHTTHIAAADAAGNWVAITTTVNTPFGSKVIVPDTGVMMNNQMDDFSIQPGVPNAFGLVGAEANAVAAGKRPLSSMSPTIVLKDNRPVMTLGAAGGPRIISQVVLTIIRCVDCGMSLPEAVAAPRVHHQWSPDRLYIEATLDAAVVKALKARGHQVALMPYAGVTQAIGIAADGQNLIGVHDPRVPGRAAGY
ncbi:MAG: gamma-glutamyltransferase [Planctomycetales bacterium]|nr:gamma-glutamyltransferase [Planctomycetales bacterium]